MSRATTVCWLAFTAAMLVGCREKVDEPTPEPVAPIDAPAPPSAQVSPRTFFPLHVGDRWRYRTEPGGIEHVGVTGVDAGGRAVMHGTTGQPIQLFVATDEEVALVSPNGARLEPLLRKPLRKGARFTYTLAEGPTPAPCEASIIEDATRVALADRTLDGCVVVERACSHPAGIFPTPTRITRTTTYCPAVGRVRERTSFEPPLPGAPGGGAREVTLLGMRVSEAPFPPHPRLDCDELVVLPSDVSAACGFTPDTVALEGAGTPPAGATTHCALAFGAAAGRVRVEAAERVSDVDAWLREGLASDAPIRTDGEIRTIGTEPRLVLVRGSRSVRVIAEGGVCPADGVARLAPLLRSLLP